MGVCAGLWALAPLAHIPWVHGMWMQMVHEATSHRGGLVIHASLLSLQKGRPHVAAHKHSVVSWRVCIHTHTPWLCGCVVVVCPWSVCKRCATRGEQRRWAAHDGATTRVCSLFWLPGTCVRGPHPPPAYGKRRPRPARAMQLAGHGRARAWGPTLRHCPSSRPSPRRPGPAHIPRPGTAIVSRQPARRHTHGRNASGGARPPRERARAHTHTRARPDPLSVPAARPPPRARPASE